MKDRESAREITLFDALRRSKASRRARSMAVGAAPGLQATTTIHGRGRKCPKMVQFLVYPCGVLVWWGGMGVSLHAPGLRDPVWLRKPPVFSIFFGDFEKSSLIN